MPGQTMLEETEQKLDKAKGNAQVCKNTIEGARWKMLNEISPSDRQFIYEDCPRVVENAVGLKLLVDELRAGVSK